MKSKYRHHQRNWWVNDRKWWVNGGFLRCAVGKCQTRRTSLHGQRQPGLGKLGLSHWGPKNGHQMTWKKNEQGPTPQAIIIYHIWRGVIGVWSRVWGHGILIQSLKQPCPAHLQSSGQQRLDLSLEQRRHHLAGSHSTSLGLCNVMKPGNPTVGLGWNLDMFVEIVA